MALALVVEDDPVTRVVHLNVLGRLAGVSAIGAATVAEAVAIIEAEPPDIAILDLRLPDGTGLDVLTSIMARRTPACVVLASAHMDEFAKEIARAGPTLHLIEKPFTPNQLMSVLRLATSSLLDAGLPFSPSDCLQLACMGAHSIILECSAPEIVRVFVHEGNLWAAHSGESFGEVAFRTLMNAQESEVISCRPLLGEPPPRNIEGAWQRLLIDAAKLADSGSWERPIAASTSETIAALTRQLCPENTDESDVLSSHPPTQAIEHYHEEVPRDASSTDQRLFDEHMRAGARAVLREDFALAQSEFAAAAALQPTHPVVTLNLDRLRSLGFK